MNVTESTIIAPPVLIDPIKNPAAPNPINSANLEIVDLRAIP